MNIPIGVIVIMILFGSGMLAMASSRFLPDEHRNAETKALVVLAAAGISMLASLVLALQISSASASFTAKTQDVAQISADVITLDRLLRRYGLETQEIRGLLRRYTAAKLHDLFPERRGEAPNLESNTTASLLEELQDKLLALAPTNQTQNWLRTQALQLTGEMLTTRWRLGLEERGRTPHLEILVLFWFVIIFASWGLFAPRNTTSVAAVFLCSLAIGTAIRMTDELQIPFSGFIRLSSIPLAHALDVISH
jgi:hypothetical protein